MGHSLNWQKQRDLSSEPQNPHKKAGSYECIIPAPGRQRLKVLGVFWLVCLTLGSVRDPVSKYKGERLEEDIACQSLAPRDGHEHVHEQTPTWTWTYPPYNITHTDTHTYTPQTLIQRDRRLLIYTLLLPISDFHTVPSINVSSLFPTCSY